MKSYFALGVFVALSCIELGGVANAQQPNLSSPSLLPLSDVQYEYPTTPYPNTPVGGYQEPVPAWQPPQGAVFGRRPTNTNSALVQANPEEVPTPALPKDDKYADDNKGPYLDAMSSPYGSGCKDGNCGRRHGFGWGHSTYVAGAEGGYGDENCGCTYGGGCCGHGWWGSVSGLVMGRDIGNPWFFSFFDGNEAAQFTTQEYNWGGGVQASIGKKFCCGCGQYGLEWVYWGLYPAENEQNTFAGQAPGNLNAILNFNQLNYNGGLASLSTNNAARHRLLTNYEIHNVEYNIVNFTYGGMGAAGPARMSVNYGAGFRWFRFRDTLQFASDPTDGVFNGAADEIFYDIDVTNDLVGFQLAGQGNYWFTDRFNASMGTKFGVFGNYIQHSSRIGGTAGEAVINNGPFIGRPWNITGDTGTVAFLGEFDAGLTYAIGCRWSIFGGYRAVAVSNVALTTNQIYFDLRGINDVVDINHNGSLILHGAYLGAQYTW